MITGRDGRFQGGAHKDRRKSQQPKGLRPSHQTRAPDQSPFRASQSMFYQGNWHKSTTLWKRLAELSERSVDDKENPTFLWKEERKREQHQWIVHWHSITRKHELEPCRSSPHGHQFTQRYGPICYIATEMHKKIHLCQRGIITCTVATNTWSRTRHV